MSIVPTATSGEIFDFVLKFDPSRVSWTLLVLPSALLDHFYFVMDF